LPNGAQQSVIREWFGQEFDRARFHRLDSRRDVAVTGDEDYRHVGPFGRDPLLLQKIEFAAPEYLRNVLRIITETGLRIYKELTPMKKEQLDLENRTVWIPDSKTPNGIAEVPLTEIAAEAFQKQIGLSGSSAFLFPSGENPDGYQKTFKTVWHATLRRAKVRYFRIYDLRSTYATRLSAGGVADEWVTQLLRQGDAKVFKKYSQMKLQMKREALAKLNRHANEISPSFGTAQSHSGPGFGTVLAQ
jgi:integrase